MRVILLRIWRVQLLNAMAARYLAGPLLRRLVGRPLPPEQVGVRLRRLFESMGVMYMKLGQYLAARFDLLPREVCNELGRLFDDVAPMRRKPLRRQVERQLGRPLGDAFADFDAEPIGYASVAQVHRARTRDGDDVAIKVRRTGVEHVFEADIATLLVIARLADALIRLALPVADVVGE